MDDNQKKVKEIVSHTGFKIDDIRELPEIKTALYQMHYKKNGAKLVWLNRREENKTFAIAFKTLPNDDTGVFHILEHSLLCGSEKYPVSKPFVEMIKSSLQTFMNAFTFPDKTMYPVCSRNDQDFLNLMDVYLDAVFHPLCIKKKDIFLQEGWHYEMEEPEGELCCNGVVYNEMKGVYASPDTLIDSGLNSMLFPDNCYRFQSGGDPEHITELTYENYTASYKKFYHPSNAYIILDGDMEIDQVLSRIGDVLKKYDRQDIDTDIPLQKSIEPEEVSRYYEVSEREDTENKMLLAAGWVYGRFDEPEKSIACSALAEALCATNESPLKKILIENGLAEDAELSRTDGIQQSYLKLVVRNVPETKKEQVWSAIRETLERLADEGMNHKNLEAILNRMEFNMHERESGSFPEGVVNAMHVLESWLYGGDPAQNLSCRQIFCSLQSKLKEGYFEQLIREILLENPHCAKMALYPSKTIGEEKRKREASCLQEVKNSWSEEKKKTVIEEFEMLREIQGTPDNPEMLKTLPLLSLSDIPEVQKVIPQTVMQIEGNTVLRHKLESDGIVHITYYFPLEDYTQEELHAVSFLRILLGQTETGNYSAFDMQAELKRSLGRFEVSADVFAERGQTKECKPCLIINVSVLEDKLKEALRLLGEVLNRSRFDDISYIRSRIRQLRLSMEQHILMSGDSYASRLIAAEFSARGAALESLQGIQMLRWIQLIDDNFEQEGKSLAGELASLCRGIFTRERVVLSVTGNVEEEWIQKFLHLLPDGQTKERPKVKYETLNSGKRGILIPAEIGFAGKGANLAVCGVQYHGALQVAARILSYGYLWNTIRVKGGAYGTRLTVSGNGDVVFTSFRDPSPADSLKSFDGAGTALRSLCKSGEGLDRYIISTIAATEPLLSVRQKGLRAAEDYLSGMTAGMRQKVRSEILHTTREDLLWAGDVIEQICEKSGACIVGGKTALHAAAAVLTQTESL